MAIQLGNARRRLTVIVLAGVLIVAGGGAALAYWTSTGEGTGSATTGEAVDFVVASTPATGPELTPGGPAQTVAFTVTNPGTGSQILNSVAVTVADADGTVWDDEAGCSEADYTVGTPAITYGEIAAGATVSGTVTIAMDNLPVNQDGCKGVTVPLYLLAS